MMKCPYDEKADLWSVGVMMYQLYYKKIPYDGKTEKDILDRIIYNYPYKQPDDKYFGDLLNKILVKDPRNRISWDEYFNHPFWKEIPLEIMNQKSMFTSFNYEYDNPNIKGSLLQQSINNDINEGIFNVGCDIYGKSKSEELINYNKYKIELHDKGRNINDNEYKDIIKTCLNIFKSKEETPISTSCSEEIRNKLGGEWFVFVSDEIEDNYDFYISNSYDGRFISFNIGDMLF